VDVNCTAGGPKETASVKSAAAAVVSADVGTPNMADAPVQVETTATSMADAAASRRT